MTNAGGEELADDAWVDFFVLSADADHDRDVDNSDYATLSSHLFMSGSNITFSEGDFDYDHDVDMSDFGILFSHFGTYLPAPPALGQITVGNQTESSIELNWIDNVTGEAGWRVQRATAGGSYDWYIDLPADTHTWTATGLPEGTRYSFRVRAFGNGQDTAYTPKHAATTLLPGPTDVAIEQVTGESVTLTWVDHANDELGFNIYRSQAGMNDWTLVGTTGQDETWFVDTTVAELSSYDYYVQAFSLHAVSVQSQPATVTTLLRTPDQVTLVFEPFDDPEYGYPGTGTLTVSWHNNSQFHDGFVIWQSREGEAAQILRTVFNPTDTSEIFYIHRYYESLWNWEGHSYIQVQAVNSQTGHASALSDKVFFNREPQRQINGNLGGPLTEFYIGTQSHRPQSAVLTMAVRDFNIEYPDFAPNALSRLRGLVEQELGQDGRPVLSQPGPRITSIASPETFALWFNDAPGINATTLVHLPLQRNPEGFYVFSPPEPEFLPIFTLLDVPWPGASKGLFTVHAHSSFKYQGGEQFWISSDDDAWLFINGKLAIDLGGVHPDSPSLVFLDNKASQLGITPGNEYNFDLFYAERFWGTSRLSLQTDAVLKSTDTYVYQVSASDGDGDTLLYYFNEAPDDAVIDPLTGLITWTPTEPGEYDFAVCAYDGTVHVELLNWTVQVNQWPDDSLPDLDIDSNNDNGNNLPNRSQTEDRIESHVYKGGKLILVNEDDTDNDMVPDYADFDGIQGERFVPLVLDLSEFSDPSTVVLKWNYDAADPQTPTGGKLRIWTKDGYEIRSPSDCLDADTEYAAEAFGFDAFNAVKVFFVEAIEGSWPEATSVQVLVDPDGVGPEGFTRVDEVKVTSARVAPPRPANLSASLDGRLIYLEWGYMPGVIINLYRSTTPNFEISAANLLFSSDYETECHDQGLPGETTYYYKLTAAYPGGFESEPSEEISITLPPPAPEEVWASPSGIHSVNLAWSSSWPDVTFAVYRGTDENFTPEPGNLRASGLKTTQYIDSVPGPGVYWYKVLASKDGLESAPTAVVGVAITPPPPPAAPSNVKAVRVAPNRIAVSWDDNAINETGFIVKRSADGGATWTTLAENIPANTRSYVDNNVSPDVTYTYAVLAKNEGGSSGTPPSSQPVPPLPPPPSVVVGGRPIVSATYNAAANTITLTWTHAGSPGGYRIDHLWGDTAQGSYLWLPAATVGDVRTTTLSGYSEGSIQSFRVVATNGSQEERSAPVRVYLGALMDPKAVALKLLTTVEALHRNQPYYLETYMTGNSDSPIQGLFDQEALALDEVDVQIDNSMDRAAGYSATWNIIYIKTTGYPMDVVHELVHTIDDFREINDLTWNLRDAEGMAHAVEYLLEGICMTPNGLSDMITNPAGTNAPSGTADTVDWHWHTAWHRINRVIGKDFLYEAFLGGGTSTVNSGDLSKLGMFLNVYLPESKLRPIYASALQRQLTPPSQLNTWFT